MDYSIKNYTLLKSLLGKELTDMKTFELFTDDYWEKVYFSIAGRIVVITNSEMEVKLEANSEPLTLLDVSESNEIGKFNKEMVFTQLIKDIVVTNECYCSAESDYCFKSTKAITFILTDLTITVSKDSWTDEGLKIIFGDNWDEMIAQYSTCIYDEDSVYSSSKTVEYIKVSTVKTY
ncbi:MAG: hypothetical protein HUJ57_03400 [Erysipelotrichaceae bacterium]|nr:hypothetical protein [Erysipelotrichaceae bacterium]